jgi:integral membrane sensor domain MASE1
MCYKNNAHISFFSLYTKNQQTLFKEQKNKNAFHLLCLPLFMNTERQKHKTKKENKQNVKQTRNQPYSFQEKQK